MRNHVLTTVVAALLAALCSEVAVANDYPSRPIRMLVTTGAGGAGDLVARAIAERFSQSMGQPVTVENNPSANGGVMAGQLAKATPDGYTLSVMVDSTLTSNPHLYKNLSYDPSKDFEPIGIISKLPLVLVANRELKADDVRGVIGLAKAAPGKLTYASTGIGTQLHIGMELLKLRAGIDLLHVPYRTTTSAMTDVMGGRIDMVMVGQSSAKAQAEVPQLKLLGIAALNRSALLPNVPPISEAGLDGYEVTSYFVLLAPAKMPREIVMRLSDELKKAASDPRFIAALEPQGMEIVASSPEEMRTTMEKTSEKWRDVIKATGTTVNQ
ncbi:Bug family tripartite tricarboxylate transporter substrate binding protein [Undibacter mobilis]|nr:tripartite tricarboxylate transporter substrate binding protein [Undibacter mobilis]